MISVPRLVLERDRHSKFEKEKTRNQRNIILITGDYFDKLSEHLVAILITV